MEVLENLKKYRVILASKSPRRQQLLAQLCVDFDVDVLPGVDESYPADLPLDEIPLHIARKKLEAHRVLIESNELIITSDTVVILDDKVLGKPADAQEAKAMLQALANCTHRVTTGVAIASKDKELSFGVTTEVDFSPLSEAEIDFYVSRFNPMDKAGAYGIQEWIGAAGITGIRGSFYNVMGLPLRRLYEALKEF